MENKTNEIKLEWRWKIYSGDELLEMDIEETDFLVEKLIPESGICMIVGEPNSHKSWIMLEIAKMVSLGKNLFGTLKTKRSKVLYVDSEAPLPEIKRRWEMLKGEKGTNVSFISLSGLQIDNDNDLDELAEIIRNEGFSVIIFDSFRDIWDGDENNNQQARNVMKALAKLQQLGCTVIISHHKPRPTAIGSAQHAVRGSTVFEAKCDSILVIRKNKENGMMHEITIGQTKLREGIKTPDFVIGMNEKDGHVNFEFVGETASKKSAEEMACGAITQLFTESSPMYESEVIKALKDQYPPITLRRAFNVMVERKAITLDHYGKSNSKYYRLVGK